MTQSNHYSPDWETVVRSTASDIRRLASVWRYSSIPISVDENTAEHSYWVALYALMVHKEVSRENFQEHFGYVALYAILHDAAECVTGDVVRVFKYTTPELKQEIDRAEGILFANLVPEVRQLFNFFNNQTDHTVQKYVKDIVKVADFLSLLQFMRREAMRGNLEIYPYFGRMITDLEKTTVEMEGKAHIIQLGKTEGNPFKPADVYNAMLEEAKRVKHVCFRTDPTSIL